MKENFKLKYSYIHFFQVQFLVFLKTKAPETSYSLFSFGKNQLRNVMKDIKFEFQ